MEILELPAAALVIALVIALVTLQLCNARYHRGGLVYWSVDTPKSLNMYNTTHTVRFTAEEEGKGVCSHLATGQHLSLPE
jgi:hypothetical protein